MCREWRNIGEDPRLWRDVAVTLDCGNVELTRTVLGFRRFLFLKKLTLICGPQTKYCKCARHLQEQEEQFYEVLSCIVRHQKTEQVALNLHPLILTNVTISKFHNFITFWTSLKVLELKNVKLNNYQMETVFMRMKNKSNLEELCLEDIDLQGISSQILAEALNKLERLTILDDVKISKEQLGTIFKTMSNDTNLKTLTLYRGNLDETDLSDIDPCDFGNGGSKLSKLSICGYISRNQLNALLKNVVQKSKLKALELGYCGSFYHQELFCSLKNVNPFLLKEAIHKLEKFSLKYTGHCTAGWHLEMFQNIQEDDLKMVHLDTTGSSCLSATNNLSKLLKLFAKLASLSVASTGLHETSTPLFKTIMEGGSNLSQLDISNNDLSHVDPCVLAMSINMLKIVRMENASLSKDQVKYIFCNMARSTALEDLNINKNDISHVEDNTLAVAVNKLRKAQLDSTYITMNQLVKMFSKCCEKTRLSLLSLGLNQEIKHVMYRDNLLLLRKVDRYINKLIL